jgi:chromatin segregation and condensation protein Rec8/ScpA/Scc1 (kleisin family)
MNTLPALYQIADQYLQDVAKLQDLDLDPQTVADTLESMGGDLEAKATNVAMFVRNLESLADQIKQAEASMAARRKAIETRADNVREYLLSNMLRTGISKIESPYFKIALRNNPPSVVVDDPSLIPAKYMRQAEPPAPAPDKKEIKAAIEFGENVPGARLVTKQSVTIK